MKHIDKYNKFIKLNEDIEIEGDINEYDLNIIKDALIDLEDLGWEIYLIRKDDEYNISLSLNKRRISDGMIFWKSRFNKKFFYFETKKMKKDNHDFFIKKSELCDYDLSKSERYMLNTIKDCSLFLINILDCNYGKYSLLTNHSNFIYSLHITLSKNNIK